MNLDSLQELGLSKGQVAVYSAVLELGTANISSIQEKVGIERRNIYDILNKLIERGLISFTIENGLKTYQCTHPDNLKDKISKKEEILSELNDKISQIKDLYNSSKVEVRAETYRGKEAMKSMLNEVLEHSESYWIGGNSGVENTVLKIWFKHWMDRRVKQKHFMYDLVDYGTHLEGLKPADIDVHKKNLYKRCELPKDLASPVVVIVFGNKVAQIIWGQQSFAFILESKEIKDNFMKYFNYFWKNPY